MKEKIINNCLKTKTIIMDYFRNNKKKGIAAVLVFVMAVAGVGVFKTTTDKRTAMAMTKMPSVSKITTDALDKRISASGTTVAADVNKIFIELSQEVKEVFAEVGDVVEEGQLLVTYNIEETKRELENKVQEASISLQNAQITLNELKSPATGTELLELKSAVVTAEKSVSDAKAETESLKLKIKQAETSVESAKRDLENAKELLTVGGITQIEYENYENLYNSAELSLSENKSSLTSKEKSLESLNLSMEKAKLNLANGQNKYNDVSTANSIKKQENAVTTANTNYETALENLAKLTEATYSPISGTIITSNAVEGQMLTDSTVMMEIADLTNLDVEAFVSEYDIAQIEVGQKVELTNDGIEGVTYHGTVTKIEPVASSQSTTSGSETVVPIVVYLDDNDNLVKPGFTFDLEIIVQEMPEGTEFIPISSVMKDNETGETYVFEVDKDQKLKKTIVELGTYSDMYVEIKSGLTAEATFLTSPSDKMTEGSYLADFATTVEETKIKETERAEEPMIMQSIPMGGGSAPSGGSMKMSGGRG